jgi:hypothetical protein
MLVSRGTINPPFCIKSFRLLLKQIFGFTNARKRFLYLLNLFSSSLVNFWFQFHVFIIHSRIALIRSSFADVSNARLDWGQTLQVRGGSVTVTLTSSLPSKAAKRVCLPRKYLYSKFQ